MEENYPTVLVEEALARFLAYFHPLESERVTALGGFDRVLGEDTVAAYGIPPHADSAMDG